MDLNEIMARQAVNGGEEAIIAVRDVLTRALREIDSYAESYDNAESLRKKAEVLNWVINYCASNILGNMRLDVVSARQGQLIEAASRKD